MESAECNKTLPYHLVERIVAMVPFPHIFKARCLSKAWRAKFLSVAEQADERDKLTARCFQQEVRNRGKDWGTCFPVHINSTSSCGFDWGSQSWIPLPSLSFLPAEVVDRSRITCEGAYTGLLLLSHYNPGNLSLYVANMFTRSWKILPPNPFDSGEEYTAERLVSDSPCGPYKVIMLNRSKYDDWEDGNQSLVIYKSNTNAWSRARVCFHPSHFAGLQHKLVKSQILYLNGVLYSFSGPIGQWQVLTLNMEDGRQANLRLVYNQVIGDGRQTINSFPTLLVCNSQLVMIMHESLTRVRILRIDPVSLEITEMSRGPPSSLDYPTSYIKQCPPLSRGNKIMFHYTYGRTVLYNMVKNEWSLLWPPGINDISDNNVCFEPGLDLFRTV